MAIKFRYTGDGAFLPGIPARDLDDEDVKALSPDQRAEVEANAALAEGAIYQKADAKKAASEGE